MSWQITPRVLTDAFNSGGAEAKRAFAAMMDMGKIDISCACPTPSHHPLKEAPLTCSKNDP